MNTTTAAKPNTQRRNKYDVDEILDTPFSFSHIKRSFKYIKKYAGSLLLIIVLSLISIVAALMLPYLLMQVTDKCIPTGDVQGILWIAALGAALVLTILYITRKKDMICKSTGQKIVCEIREDLFAHLQTLPFDYFDSRPHGKILVRVVNYVNTIADFVANGLVNLVLELLSLLIIPIFMFATDARLTWLILSGVIPFLLYILLIKKAQRRAVRLYSNKNSNINAYYQESIDGMKITQSFSRESVNLQTAQNMAEACKQAFNRCKVIQHSLTPAFRIISALAICVLYYYGISDENMVSVGVVMAMATYCKRFWQPLINLGNLYNQVQDAAAYLERIFEVMDTPSVIHDEEGATELPPIKGDVQFSHVHFSYEPGIPILENVSFKVRAGESIALVGPTGAGKTTIVNLLSRFYDIDGGKITIDGHDIHAVTLHSLRSQMGIMLQDTFIFTGTIMENIKYGRLDATDEEAINAAKTVCAHDFIQALPNGYDTVVSERGASLSAGQRQLISFARTLLSDPKILVLDEATSAMDTKTELLVQRGLAQLLKGRTSFIIAHRLSTIKNSTRILYIAHKNIAEAGNHDQLIAARGLYYNLYTAQLE